MSRPPLPGDALPRLAELYAMETGVAAAQQWLARLEGAQLTPEVEQRWHYAVDELINVLDAAGLLDLDAYAEPEHAGPPTQA